MDHVCDTPIVQANEDDGVITFLYVIRVGASLRHLGRHFGRQRVRLNVRWHGVADRLRGILARLRQIQVRLMVRGWGAIAGLSASCARKTCSDGERIMPKENVAATMRSPGYPGIMNTFCIPEVPISLGARLERPSSLVGRKAPLLARYDKRTRGPACRSFLVIGAACMAKRTEMLVPALQIAALPMRNLCLSGSSPTSIALGRQGGNPIPRYPCRPAQKPK